MPAAVLASVDVYLLVLLARSLTRASSSSSSTTTSHHTVVPCRSCPPCQAIQRGISGRAMRSMMGASGATASMPNLNAPPTRQEETRNGLADMQAQDEADSD